MEFSSRRSEELSFSDWTRKYSSRLQCKSSLPMTSLLLYCLRKCATKWKQNRFFLLYCTWLEMGQWCGSKADKRFASMNWFFSAIVGCLCLGLCIISAWLNGSIKVVPSQAVGLCVATTPSYITLSKAKVELYISMIAWSFFSVSMP